MFRFFVTPPSMLKPISRGKRSEDGHTASSIVVVHLKEEEQKSNNKKKSERHAM